MRNNTGLQASQDVVFDKYPIVTLLFPTLPKSTPRPPVPSPLIIPTYLCHGGPDGRTAATDRLDDGWYWVDTLDPIAHPRSPCVFCRDFLFHRRGLFS